MKWDLTYLFKTKEDYQKALEEVKQIIDTLSSYKGLLHEESKFVEYYTKQIQLEEKFSKVYQYVHLKSDLNKKDVEALTDLNNVELLLHKLNQETSFEDPEIIAIGYDKVMEFVKANSEIEELKFSFEKLFRKEKYTLSEKEERILSLCYPNLHAGRSLYSSLIVSDGKVKTVTLEDGKTVPVTQGNWNVLIADAKSAQDREKIFETLFSTYDEHKNALANIYSDICKGNKANMQARGYSSILESYLYHNNIPTKVYETLVDVASNVNDALKKYLKLRKEYLKLDKYHTYDRFLSLGEVTSKYTYEQGKELFLKSIEKFPEDFINKAKMAIEDGFVDVFESDGKRTGAYSSSQPNSRPFILLNYTDSLNDVFTLAHEAGHSIHSIYAMENNKTTLQGYTIFVAEIASTFNEHNLLDYLMNSGKLTKSDKIALLQKAIDSICSTFYRQTLFAEYELKVSKMVEQNIPLNHKVLSDVMVELYKKYYDLDIEEEKVKKYVWAYIPHLFYTPFYVYQYATSFAASFKLYDEVKKGVEGAFDRYINLLKAGGSKYPMEEALDAQVDFTKEETFKAVTNRMEELVNELEKLLKE